MKKYHFDDRQHWLMWRRDGIGGSDISIIMGSNKYKTPLKLWEEKCGYSAGDYINEAMIHGIQFESVARQWVNDSQKLNMTPICIQDDTVEYFRASLDGWDEEEKVICEIKCPVSSSTIDQARDFGIIPDHWMHQMQWNMSLAPFKRSLFIVWDHRTKEGIVIPIEPNIPLQEEMKEKAHEFWKLIQSGTPPEPTENDFIELDNPEIKIYLDEYSKISNQVKVLEERKKVIKDKIVEFGDDGNFKAFGYYVRRNPPRRTYDIDLMKQDGIDIDKYLKKSNEIGYYVIISPKGKNGK